MVFEGTDRLGGLEDVGDVHGHRVLPFLLQEEAFGRPALVHQGTCFIAEHQVTAGTAGGGGDPV